MITAKEKALRMNPDRYAVIYNNKYDNDGNDNVFDSSRGTIAVAAIASSLSAPTSPKPRQNRYYNEYYEGILEIAKGFLNILLSQSVNKTMVAAVKE
jgi:hypothetical protein